MVQRPALHQRHSESNQWPGVCHYRWLQAASSSRASLVKRALATLVTISLIAVLSACGGGHEAGDEKAIESAAHANAAIARVDQYTNSKQKPASEPDQALLAQGARMSNTELLAAEQAAEAASASIGLENLTPGAVASKSAYASGQVAAKAAPVRIPVFRFHNGNTGAHFYTTSTAERDHVQANLSPPFSFEGTAFSVASGFSPGLHPVHRFFNTRSGVHFYTISEAERANVAANLPHFNYEGVAYHASQVAGMGLMPFYRFYVPSRDFHFYTASQAERDNVIANLGATYTYEGVAYHVLASDWRAEKLPHTGLASSQCHQAGNNALVACSNVSATALNPDQDGHRAGINAMSYSEVPNPAGGNYARSECIRDNITGLIWEGKEPVGQRAASNTYTNHGVSVPNDAAGYISYVNSIALCGYSDWRLPRGHELLTLVDYGRTTAPRLNTTWLPNSVPGQYWSSQASSSLNDHSWQVGFAATGGSMDFSPESDSIAVRLVRGVPPSASSRFSFSTVPYGTDAAFNVVNDAWTGLQWRRCEQGQVWSGITCLGASTVFSGQEQVLDHARQQAGWRLPNIKELSSIVDQGVGNSNPRINGAAFPGASSTVQWSSTPQAGDTFVAWIVRLSDGVIYPTPRNGLGTARLVRTTQ